MGVFGRAYNSATVASYERFKLCYKRSALSLRSFRDLGELVNLASVSIYEGFKFRLYKLWLVALIILVHGTLLG